MKSVEELRKFPTRLRLEGSQSTVSPDSDRLEVEASSDALTGVIWAAGDHNLHLNGKPVPVHVPEHTIQATFNDLRKRIQAGDSRPTIGVDHFDGLGADHVPVAAEANLLEIGDMTDVALSDDGRSIVLTDSDLTNKKAVEAAQSGAFDNFQFSIVGPINLKAEGGDPVVNDDGRLVVESVTINRADVVQKGAVRTADVGDVPPLRAAASEAVSYPDRPAKAFTATLEAMAQRTANLSMKQLSDLEDFDDPASVYAEAQTVVQSRDERIQELQGNSEALTAVAEAAGVDSDNDPDVVADKVEAALSVLKEDSDALHTIAEAHGIDLSDEDADVQDVVDEHTADLRAEVAAKEATLPSYDTGNDDGPSVEDRASELKGKSPTELEAMDGKRANKILQSDAARTNYMKANAEAGSSGGSSGQDDEDAEKIAMEAMTPREAVEWSDSDKSAVSFMEAKYGESPADFADADDYIQATANGGQ